LASPGIKRIIEFFFSRLAFDSDLIEILSLETLEVVGSFSFFPVDGEVMLPPLLNAVDLPHVVDEAGGGIHCCN
jgi:hypothetical protein